MLGCSKCLKVFPRSAHGGLKGDFSGFNRHEWPSRTAEYHRMHAITVRDAQTDQHRKAYEAQSGARWSEFFRLSYFDPIKDHAIDPMHLLYLGIAKKMTKHYYTSGLLNKNDVKNIQQIADRIRVPHTVGRLPRKIASGYCSFTADQWKNWTLIYSSVALKGILPAEDFQIWLLFVRVVFLLTRKYLRKTDLELADVLLLRFAMQVERRYGKYFCTPNLHMACHLKDCIEDFSTIYAFWCFSFERYAI